MRFLCLHGRGTNSKIFEMQTAAIRYELGGNHSYDFVEGSTPAELDPRTPDLKSMLTGHDQGFSYFREDDPASALACLLDLDAYVDAEGPFDGIMAFSQSVSLAGTWLVYRQRRRLPSVRCCIFLSGGAMALDPDLLLEGYMVPLPIGKMGQVVTIPTAHIYGALDPHGAAAKEFSALCRAEVRSVYVHPGLHEVPGSGSGSSTKEIVNLTVNAIRRVISLAAQK
ncbi:Esterase citA [Paramyrothecium foliicola]|nr:Esterase citA [Paramyrothecium foliicola]